MTKVAKRAALAAAIGCLMAVAVHPLRAAPAPAGDAVRGERLYQQRCAMCHSLKRGEAKIGPSLAGLIGRRAGSQRYAYSPAMASAGHVWTPTNLDEYLQAPARKVPGTRMAISIADPADRRDIGAFLQRAR